MPSPLPHHDGSPLHVSHRAPVIGDTVRVRLRVPVGHGRLEGVRVRTTPDTEPFYVDATHVGTVDGWHWWEAPLTVGNPRVRYRWMLRHVADAAGEARIEWLSQSGLSDIETRDDEDFALVAGNPAPEWLSDAVMYQIFPDRFGRSAAADGRTLPPWAVPAAWDDPVDPVSPARTTQLYGGDLDGIREHLDHLEHLGVNLLYLTPVFPAASNHRYDATTFDTVDPLLGGDDAYARLTEAAHARGMRIIGDLTSNHSGDRHEWFLAAYTHPGAPEQEFYYFTDPGNTEYVSWLGFASLPKFDWRSAELARRFIDGPDSVVTRWLAPPFSLDGWRIDVANMTGRLGAQDDNAAVRRAIRRTMTQVRADTYLVAESTADATDDLQGDAWNGAMTYVAFTRPLWNWLGETDPAPHLDAQGQQTTVPWYFGMVVDRFPRYTAAQFARAVDRFVAGIPWAVRLGTMNTLDSHDTARFATHADPSVVPVAVGLSMTMPGLPVIWAGDEIGAQGADGELSRTPMPWDRMDEPALADRLSLYRSLVALRREHPALGTGGMRWVAVTDDALAFVREGEHETLLVVAARGDLDLAIPAGQLSGASGARPVWGEATLGVADDGAVVVTADGPAFAVLALPPVAAPAWLSRDPHRDAAASAPS